MQKDASGNTTEIRWAGNDEQVPASRSDRDQRAISLAANLLMAGIALERQVITLVRARSRP
jgi:hypothetical protein